MPITAEEAAQAPDYSISKAYDHILLSYSFEYYFIGKQDHIAVFELLGQPKVKYDDEYEFSTKYFSITANKANNKWHILSSDCYTNGLSSMPGLKNMDQVPALKFSPLSENFYVASGFIVLPENVLNDEKKLSIVFSKLGQEYKIR